MSTSANAGYLAPASSVINLEELENALQELVVGVTGLDPKLVRPRWQHRSPDQPDHNVTWCAIGIQNFMGTTSSVQHDGTGKGEDIITTWQGMELLISVYGPGAMQMITRLQGGLMLDQNRAELRIHGLALTSLESPRNVPELISGAWSDRVDLPVNMTWETRQAYGVLNLTAANGSIVTDTGVTADI